MQIKRSVLEKMIREEFQSYLSQLFEGPNEPSVVDGDASNKESDKKKKDEKDKKPAADAKPAGKPAVKSAPKAAGKPAELPVGEDPEADPELDKDVAGADDTENAEEVTGGKIADQITGKTVQSITMEPKSKTLPGAQELVITFKEIPDPLKVLLTKTGQVKFFFKGLHNEV